MAPLASLWVDPSIHNTGSELCFQVPIVDDIFVEVEECFAVAISLNVTDLMVSIADGTDMALCCIQDNDSESLSQIWLDSWSYIDL